MTRTFISEESGNPSVQSAPERRINLRPIAVPFLPQTMSLLPPIVSAPAELVSRIGGEEEAGRNPRRDAVEQNKDRGGHRAKVPHVEEDAPLSRLGRERGYPWIDAASLRHRTIAIS